jgi:hypothetical protein
VDTVYKRIITESSGIDPRNIFFDKNNPRGPATTDELILLDYGEASEQVLSAINKYINDDGNHGHGDSVIARNMDTVSLDLNVDVYFSAALSESESSALMANVENFIRVAFRELSGYEFSIEPDRVEPFSRFSFSKLGKQLHQEFPALTDIDFNANSPVHGLNVSKINALTLNPHAEV